MDWRKNQIRMGFMSIQKLKKSTIKTILAERKSSPFQSLDDFLFQVKLDLSDAMVLTNAQCFKNICCELSHREIAYIVAEFYLNDKNDNEPLRFGPIKNDLTVDEIYRLEIETFGYPISLHPLQPYRSIVSKRISLQEIYQIN